MIFKPQNALEKMAVVTPVWTSFVGSCLNLPLIVMDIFSDASDFLQNPRKVRLCNLNSKTLWKKWP